jgi:hypothetical protein
LTLSGSSFVYKINLSILYIIYYILYIIYYIIYYRIYTIEVFWKSVKPKHWTYVIPEITDIIWIYTDLANIINVYEWNYLLTHIGKDKEIRILKLNIIKKTFILYSIYSLLFEISNLKFTKSVY